MPIGRVVSMLEGGYDLEGLAKSVAVHVRTLMDAWGLSAGIPSLRPLKRRATGSRSLELIFA